MQRVFGAVNNTTLTTAGLGEKKKRRETQKKAAVAPRNIFSNQGIDEVTSMVDG